MLPPDALPAPMRVSEAMIERCRAEVEGRAKRTVRALLLGRWQRRWRMAELGEGFQFGKPIHPAPGCRIGRYAYLGSGFQSTGPVTVGDLVMVSTDCRIIGADHLTDQIGTPTRLAFAHERRPTVIEADVWIGMRVTIMEGVRLGTGCVVGTGAVVTRDVAPYTMVAGMPARVLRPRFTEEERERHHAAVFAENFTTLPKQS